MRHSATHLVVAFCTGMAVSAAPMSPLPPVSPAALSPLPVLTPRSVIPRAESHEVENACDDPAQENDKCIQGFEFHASDSDGIEERDTNNDSINDNGIEPANVEIQSDGDFDFEIDPGEDSDVERRWAPSIFHRSPTPYPENVKEDEDQELNGSDDGDDYSSVASFSAFSDDEDNFSSTASDSVFSTTAEKRDSGYETHSLDVPDNEKVEKRSVEIDDQSERHGGRTYITETSWRV